MPNLPKSSQYGPSSFRTTLRILHVVPTYFPATRYGGPIYSVHGLARAQAQMGDEVQVFTTNVNGAGVSPVQLGKSVDLEGAKVTYFPCGAGRRIYRSPAMGHALARLVPSFDVLHLHSVFLWPTLAASLVARRTGVPYVLAPRGMLVSDLITKKSRLLKTAWIRLFERSTIAHAAAVHVTSKVEAEEMSKLGLRPRHLAIVANGIDMPEHEVAAPLKENRYILCLGRLSWKKGIDRLICAMAHVPNVELIVAGNDEEGLCSRLKMIAADVGVSDRVRFTGPVYGEAKWSLIQHAEIFALASHSENFGIAVLEAMACGIPVVVTPEVGLSEVILSVGAGRVVLGEPEAFGQAIRELVADAELRRACGANGRKAVEQNFSWEIIAQRIRAVYDAYAMHNESPRHA